MDPTSRLLKDFVECFNRGVETGDFRALLKLLAPDATMTFHGRPRGPYKGRDAIEAGYRLQPPDDEMEIIDTKVRPDHVLVGYSWLREPYVRAGEMRMTMADGMVSSIEILT